MDLAFFVMVGVNASREERVAEELLLELLLLFALEFRLKFPEELAAICCFLACSIRANDYLELRTGVLMVTGLGSRLSIEADREAGRVEPCKSDADDILADEDLDEDLDELREVLWVSNFGLKVNSSSPGFLSTCSLILDSTCRFIASTYNRSNDDLSLSESSLSINSLFCFDGEWVLILGENV
jgi:hypothetical protein